MLKGDTYVCILNCLFEGDTYMCIRNCMFKGDTYVCILSVLKEHKYICI